MWDTHCWKCIIPPGIYIYIYTSYTPLAYNTLVGMLTMLPFPVFSTLIPYLFYFKYYLIDNMSSTCFPSAQSAPVLGHRRTTPVSWPVPEPCSPVYLNGGWCGFPAGIFFIPDVFPRNLIGFLRPIWYTHEISPPEHTKPCLHPYGTDALPVGR